MKKDYLIVADILKNRRLEEGLTLKELDEYSGVSYAEISKIERGERENINIRNLIKLCKCLEIDFIKLLEIAGYFDEDCDEIEEDYDEDCDEEEYECNENRDCKNCEYYCHICGECTFGE